DLGLPDMDGVTVLKRLREWSKVPVVVLSVRDREEDKIKALDMGADDYLTKPFGIGELLARARAVMRRQAPDDEQEQSTFTCANLKVDFAHRRVYLSNEEIHLTPKEY